MGGCTFWNFAKTNETAQVAFQLTVRQARYEHGNGGYTGTIAEKDEFVMVGSVETKEDANRLAEQLIEEQDERIDDKWGPAGCIEVKGEGFLFFGWASS